MVVSNSFIKAHWTLFFIITFFLSNLNAHAQFTLNPLEIGYAYLGSSTSHENEEVSQTVEALGVKLMIPIVASREKGLLITNSVKYEYLHSSFDGWPYAQIEQPQNFHNIFYNIQGIKKIGEHNRVFALVSPSFGAESGKTFGSEDFFFRFALGEIYKVNNNLSVGLGIAHTRLFKLSNWIPIVIVNYDPDGPISIRLLGPFNLNVDYGLIREKTTLSANVILRSNLFRLDPSKQDEIDNVRMTAPMLNLKVNQKLYKKVHGEFSIGSNLMRRVIFSDETGNELWNSDFDPSFYARFSLLIQVSTSQL